VGNPTTSLNAWRQLRSPGSHWRRRARVVIREVVDVLAEAAPHVLADPKELLLRVDAVYPFGPRQHHPYKAWLAERRLLINALEDAPVLPTQDEADVCDVARDMVLEGRLDDAIAAMDAQAPNRLARKCPVCGARPGDDCIDFDVTERDETLFRGPTPSGRTLDPPPGLIVPHEARLVGHLDAGPLFAARGPR